MKILDKIKFSYLSLQKLKSKKIYFFFPFYHIGGAETVHLDIIKLFHCDTKNVCVITNKSIDSSNKNAFETHINIFDIHRLISKIKVKKFALKFTSWIINNADNPTVFGCNSQFFYDLIPYLKQNVLIIDLIHAFAEDEPSASEKYSLPFTNRIDKRVVLGKKTINDFKQLYLKNNISLVNLDKITIIKNKVDTPDFFPVKPKNERLKIVFVGRNSLEKRPELFFEIANVCYDKNLNIDFFVIGDFKNYLYKIPKNTTLIGEIFNKSILNQYYINSDLLLITSSREGFPMVVLEAMAHGVIPICTDVGEIPDFINEENQNGFVIQNNQKVENIISDFVKQIENLEKARNILNELSLNAYQSVKINFGSKQFSESYVKLLKNK